MTLLKKIWQEFKSCPIDYIAKWQDSRFPWLLMTSASVFLILVAHTLFQHFVFMKPCEQCVYIRFAFFCMAIGGLITSINPKNILFKASGYLFGFWGIIQGIGYSVKLNLIHHAAHSDNPFGVQGCSAEPSFPLGLPMDKWAPDWFKPTGDCGFDAPIVPEGLEVSGLQKVLVDFYADGWYLIPSSHFINMAQACLFAYILCFILLGAMCLSWLIKMIRTKDQY